MQAPSPISRFLAPSALALAFGACLALPAAPVQAQQVSGRIQVDFGDVVFRAGVPYYRYGDYGRYDRLVVQRDGYGRPRYYRYVAPVYSVRTRLPNDDWRNAPGGWNRTVSCNANGVCTVRYYDSRYDRHYERRWRDHHRHDQQRWRDDD